MVSSKIIFVALAVLGIAMSETMATDHVIGDDKGWRLGVDYQTWAKSKHFKVGDRIIFKYPKELHNVVIVDHNGFQSCKAAPGSITLTSGNDVVELKAPGTKFYLCGLGKHCTDGPQKLAINVVA